MGVTKLKLSDISMTKPGVDVQVETDNTGVTLIIGTDVLDLFNNEGVVTLLFYPNGTIVDPEPKVLWSKKVSD